MISERAEVTFKDLLLGSERERLVFWVFFFSCRAVNLWIAALGAENRLGKVPLDPEDDLNEGAEPRWQIPVPLLLLSRLS